MLYIYRLCQHRAGGARRLHSVPDSMDARLRTSPHSSVYFLNRSLFGLTSVGREYLRKRGRKSVENKGKGKKLSVIETAPHCSWLLHSFRVLGAIKISHPGRRVGQTAERKTGSDACKYQKKTVSELFQCLCILDDCFWFCEAQKERQMLPTVTELVFCIIIQYNLFRCIAYWTSFIINI